MFPAWFALGAVAWSAAEYSIHRFVGHGPKRARVRGLGMLTPSGVAAEFNAEHLAHHADPSYFAPTSRKLLAAAVAVPTITALAAPVLGLRRAFAFGTGLTAMYGTYEVLHRRIHTHAPTGPYSRWMRRHHLLHHHKAPRDNHGVTSPVFDLMFGTHTPPERVRVPRHVAPTWLVDAAGELRPEYAEDYELVGKRARKGVEQAAEPVVVAS
jgi:hypothetical protein